MPKMKTNKAALKRFRISARGKVLFSRAGKSHLLSSKNAKRRRHLRKTGALHTFNSQIIRRLCGREGLTGQDRVQAPESPAKA